MLTITDLTADLTLETAAMSTVRGGASLMPTPFSYLGVFNTPTIDVGTHSLVQGQASVIDQTGSVGGFNAVGSNQTQNGISGQVSFF